MDDDLRVLAVLLDKPGPSGEVFDTGRRRLLNEIRGQLPRPAPVLGSGHRATRRRAGWVVGVALLAAATSRAIRARRRIAALAGALTAAAAATAAAVLVLTSGQGIVAAQQGTAGHARTVVTAAWTVREAASGTVTITLRQYANAAGLQRTLRADGVNAIVRAVPSHLLTPQGRKPGQTLPVRPVTGCSYATTNDAPPTVQRAVVTIVTQVRQEPGGGLMRVATFIIHPHAMPPGSALFLPYGTNTLPATMKGSRDPGKPARVYPYPHVKPFDPVVLNNDTVPACVAFTKPGSTLAPPVK
jgi:hypothetical protein